MAAGGALFGLLYALVLAFTSRAMSLAIRPRIHFYAAVAVSILITAVTCEFSFQNATSINPLLVLAGIVGCTFVVGISTGKKLE